MAYSQVNDVATANIAQINDVNYSSIAQVNDNDSPASGATQWVAAQDDRRIAFAAKSAVGSQLSVQWL